MGVRRDRASRCIKRNYLQRGLRAALAAAMWAAYSSAPCVLTRDRALSEQRRVLRNVQLKGTQLPTLTWMSGVQPPTNHHCQECRAHDHAGSSESDTRRPVSSTPSPLPTNWTARSRC